MYFALWRTVQLVGGAKTAHSGSAKIECGHANSIVVGIPGCEGVELPTSAIVSFVNYSLLFVVLRLLSE